MGSAMNYPTSNLAFVTAWFMTAATLSAGAPDNQAEKAACIGQPVSHMVLSETIRLAGPRAMRQILVTGRYSDGSERDLTNFCELQAEAPELVRISRGGLLRPQAAGETALVVQAGEQTVRVPVVVTDLDKSRPVSFRHEFIA